METKRILLIAGGAFAAILLQTASARLHAQAQTGTAFEKGRLGVLVECER